MPLTISLLGATGVYARHLLPRLAARGHHVRALVRTPEAAVVARACGAEVHRADLYDPDSLRAALAGSDVAVNLVTALRGRPGENDRARREGAPIFLRACADAGVARALQQSIAWVNASGTDAWTDEDALYPPDETRSGQSIATALAMEDAVRASNLDWVILRGGLFYGPGTSNGPAWFDQAQAGRLELPRDGSDFVSLIHIADMAEATAAAIERWPSRQALIIADDSPARWAEIFGYVAALAGADNPRPGGPPRTPSNRLRNTRARDLLGWAPHYPDYRTGLAR